MYENDNNMNTAFSEGYETTVSGVDNVTRKGRGRKAAMMAGGIAAIIAGGSITAYAVSDTVKNQVKLRVSSPEKYYAWVTEKNSETIGETVGEYYRKMLENREKGQEISFDLSFEPSQDTKKLLTDEVFSASDVPKELRNVINDTDKYVFSSDHNIKKSSFSSAAELLMDDKSVLHFDIAADSKDMNYFLRIPELREQWLGVEMGGSRSLYGMSGLMNSYKALLEDPSSFISPDELEKEVNRYAGVWANFADEVRLEKKESVDICDISVNYTVATVSITDKDFSKLALQYLEEMKNDKILKEIAVNKLNLVDDEAEYMEELDEDINDIKDVFEKNEYDNESIIIIDTYIDATGTIRGFGIKTDDASDGITMVFGRDGSDIRGEMRYFENSDEEFTVQLKAAESGKSYTGDITFMFSDLYGGYDDNESESVCIKFSDVEVKDEEKGFFNGDFSIIIPDNAPINISCSSDGKSQNVVYDLIIDDMDYGRISLGYSVEKGSDVKLPDRNGAFMLDLNNIGGADIDDYITSDDIRDFVSATLEKIGLDKSSAEKAGDAVKEGYDRRADERASWDDYDWDSDDFDWDSDDFDWDSDDYDFDFDDEDFRGTAGSDEIIGGSDNNGLDFEFDPSQFKYEDFKDQMTEEEFSQWMDLMEQFTKKVS